MTKHECSSTPAAIHADAPAEDLFFGQYRHWMAGFATQDMGYWNAAWNTLLHYLAPDRARILYGEFHYFTRVLNTAMPRPIGWKPDVCRCLCRDELLVLKLVVASQHGDLEGELKAACELAGEKPHPLLVASRALAASLKTHNFILKPTKTQSATQAAEMSSAPVPGALLH